MIKITDKRSKWRIYKMFKLFSINNRLIVCYKKTFNNFIDELFSDLNSISETILNVILSPFIIVYSLFMIILNLISTIIPRLRYFNGSEEDLNYDYEKAQEGRIETAINNLEDLNWRNE